MLPCFTGYWTCPSPVPTGNNKASTEGQNFDEEKGIMRARAEGSIRLLDNLYHILVYPKQVLS